MHGDGQSQPDPTAVVRLFVERSAARLAAGEGHYTASEYLTALKTLSLEMLERKQLRPFFTDVIKWLREHSGAAQKIREIVRMGEVARLDGCGEKETITFRHDRVRGYLLADALSHALHQGELSQSVMSDPYFADLIGVALVSEKAAKAGIDRVARVNPLALFSAMRHFRRPQTEAQQHIIRAASTWVDNNNLEGPCNDSLRHAILWILAECEGSHVKSLVEGIDSTGNNWLGLRGRFRNGDVSAGIGLCAQVEPGIGWIGHVELIEHVLSRFRDRVLMTLDGVLRRRDLSMAVRRGPLRLAGYAGSAFLSEALQESWRIDGGRREALSDYLWASSQCCGEEPENLLGPIFDAWAALPDEDEGGGASPRWRLGADHLRWAFRDRIPSNALDYFLLRAQDPGLRWPLLEMLNGIDHPDIVEFVVTELARLDEEGKRTTFGNMAFAEWSRRRRFGGEVMKGESRQRLRDLWSREDSGKYLARHALRLWSATVKPQDLSVLRTVETSSDIGDVALFERLRRGDQTAIPDLVPKLNGGNAGYWWQAGRYLWSEELTKCLDRALGRIAGQDVGGDNDLPRESWLLPQLVMELAPATGERLMLAHWDRVSQLASYVQAALYLASPGVRDKVREVVKQCEDPQSLFRHLGFAFGINAEHRRGITRLAQMDALLPYIDHLSHGDIRLLWEACNENRWFEWRRQHLDRHAKRAGGRFVDASAALEELDRDLGRSEPFPWTDHWGEAVLKTG